MNAPATAFRPARKSEAKPIVGLYAESGNGKTWSALLLARGYAGPAGKIGMIETEGGRGEAYVGRVPVGDYLVRPIRGNFSPEEYGKAISDAEKENLDVLIIDSASHEWEGEGGVLAMAAANDAAGKKGVLVWQQPKILHQRHFMLRLMQTPIPLVIVCMRAKYPMEQKGSAWARSNVLEPKQAADVLFEMFVHGWIDDTHKLHVTKHTLPELAKVIIDNEPVSIETGQRLAAWARGTNSPGNAATATAASPKAPEANGGAAELSTAMQLADDTLTAAARKGAVALKDAWQNLDATERTALKSRLDAVHKPAAQLVDAKDGVSA